MNGCRFPNTECAMADEMAVESTAGNTMCCGAVVVESMEPATLSSLINLVSSEKMAPKGRLVADVVAVVVLLLLLVGS